MKHRNLVKYEGKIFYVIDSIIVYRAHTVIDNYNICFNCFYDDKLHTCAKNVDARPCDNLGLEAKYRLELFPIGCLLEELQKE